MHEWLKVSVVQTPEGSLPNEVGLGFQGESEAGRRHYTRSRPTNQDFILPASSTNLGSGVITYLELNYCPIEVSAANV